jgi:hypothetical protein
MLDSLSVLSSFPTVGECTQANWTWTDDPYDDGYYADDREKEVVWPWSKDNKKGNY